MSTSMYFVAKSASIQPRTSPPTFVTKALHLTITTPGFVILAAQVRGRAARAGEEDDRCGAGLHHPDPGADQPD